MGEIYNPTSGDGLDALLERSVAALVREWGVGEVEAREALLRNMSVQRRLGLMARYWVWREDVA